jgi:hypothetical protein
MAIICRVVQETVVPDLPAEFSYLLGHVLSLVVCLPPIRLSGTLNLLTLALIRRLIALATLLHSWKILQGYL